MKAALITQFGAPLEVLDFPEPQPGKKDVLVKVSVCGVCYSDVKIWTRKSAVPPVLPHILGHEIAGTIASCGEEVSGFEKGDRVIIYLYDTCDRCNACKTGRDNCCVAMGPLLGFTRHGGFAEYVSVPSKNVFKIPKEIDFKTAALLPDAVITPYHAIVDRANVRLNETVLLQGMGGLALSGLQIAKLLGARVIAVSRSENKLEMARNLGADITIRADSIDIPNEVKKITDGEGVDCAIDFVCNEKTIDNCIRSIRKGGRTVLMAYNTAPTPINTALLMSTVGTIIHSRSGTRQNLRDIIRLASEGKIKSVLTETRPLSKVNEVLMGLSEGNIVGRAALEI